MTIKKHNVNYIDGKWIDSLAGKKRDVINPATNQVIATTAEGGREDAKLAIKAAARVL